MKPWYMHLKICAQELCTHVLDLWVLIIMHKKYLYIRSICIHWYRPVCECIICLYIWYLRTHTSSGCLKENNPPELHSFQTEPLIHSTDHLITHSLPFSWGTAKWTLSLGSVPPRVGQLPIGGHGPNFGGTFNKKQSLLDPKENPFWSCKRTLVNFRC